MRFDHAAHRSQGSGTRERLLTPHCLPNYLIGLPIIVTQHL